MARTTHTLPRRSKDPYVVIARKMRAARRRAGDPSLAVMAERAGVSIGLLSQAQNGDPHMTWRTVRAWAAACGEPIAVWERHWHELETSRRTAGGMPAAAEVGPVVKGARELWIKEQNLRVVPGIRSVRELVRVLDELRRHRGLSLRQVADAAGGCSHTTVREVLRGGRRCTPRHLAQVLTGCGVPDGDQVGWMELLVRLTESDASVLARAAAKRVLPVQRFTRRRGRPEARLHDALWLTDQPDSGSWTLYTSLLQEAVDSVTGGDMEALARIWRMHIEDARAVYAGMAIPQSSVFVRLVEALGLGKGDTAALVKRRDFAAYYLHHPGAWTS
ncbi:helix-turn-helix transcriptional regulator [Kitasatospora cinereorecta]|uniref:Helix-turn-helix domain-containing protein n=1 Tax=Kitasatospora cinereorecta TaxID=285560 RepID=A0ABW0VRD4_9ACTN